MFIVECLPFSKGLNRESLSYFSSLPIEEGSLIKISIRGRNLPALVLGSRDAKEVKSEIRSADFQIKKISSFTAKPFLQKEFLETIRESSDYFVSTQGAVLSCLIPSFVIENVNTLHIHKNEFSDKDQKNSIGDKEIKAETLVLQESDEERFDHYKSLIREEFAKKKSVFLCLPQNEDVKYAKDKLERGIESFVVALYKDLTKKSLREALKKAVCPSHPMLIIGTASWLFLPRKDFGTIIIDKENENGWKTAFRPFIDLRFIAEKLANKKNVRCIIGDSFLRVETLRRYNQMEIGEFERLKWKPAANNTTKVIDLREVTKKEKEFRVLSPEMLDLIKETVEIRSHMFIFAARKGIASTTICRDCGEQVKCFNCSSPMILYKKIRPYRSTRESDSIFRCHQCGETRDAAEVCQNCRSWKLSSFGMGIDLVAEEIRKNFENIDLFEIHKDITDTASKAQRIVSNFYETKGSVLLGTEMAFSYLPRKIRSSAIASFDSMFSIPDFRIREKIFRTILQTKNLAKEKFLIQTRNPNDPTIEFAASNNLLAFYEKEIEDRRSLEYPPFGIFIKITVRGTKNFVTKETEKLKKYLEKYNSTIFNSIHEKKGEQLAANAVIKLNHSEWFDFSQASQEKPGLFNALKSLPSHFEIKVDPDNLL